MVGRWPGPLAAWPGGPIQVIERPDRARVRARAPSGPVRRPEDLTAEWLTSVLTDAGVLAPGCVAHTLSVSPVGTGQMADTVRVCFSTDPSVEAPRSVIAKFASADEQSRSTGLMTRAYEIEVGFYGEVASRVGTRMPECYLSHFEPDTGWFVILLEDVVDGVQGAHLEGCDADVAEAALVEMAALHGPAWSDRHLAKVGWLHRGGPEADEFIAGLVTSLWPGFVERYGSRIDADHLDLGDHLIGVLGPWLADRSAANTVVHGDFRLDNLLFCPGQTRPYVVDWQTADWGSAASDVSYLVAGSLTVEDRRRHGEQLLRTYHGALVAQGVTGYGLGQLEEDFRRMCFGGLVMSIGASMLVKRTERGDDMFVTTVGRYAQQALDLDAETLLPGPPHR